MSGVRDRYAELGGDPHQVGQRVRVHLAHKIASVDLEGDLADSKFGGSLFIHQSTHNEGKDVSFPCGQAIQSALQLIEYGSVATCLAIALECRLDRGKQFVIPERFGKKIHRAEFHGANRHGDVSVPGYENDRWVRFICQPGLELEPVDVWKSHVEHET